ncbi:hypothetical protein F4810DRAFT_662045 [Camillea tinctor]|nr:hypothetical protein F4810DRAFT_662045 [Camillea tinctor]
MASAPVGTLIGALPRNGPGKTDIIVETIFLALDFVSVGLRLWSRHLQRMRLQINDILIIAALTILTARYAIEVSLVLECGLGLHAEEVAEIGGPDMVILFRKLVFVIDLMWLTLVTLIKTSILHFYLVIFRQTVFVRVVYLVLGLVIAFYIAAFFSDVFFCIPPEKSWLPDTPGHCGDSSTIYIALASTDLTIDIIVILLPMPILWGLQLPTPRKVALTFVFGLGFIIIAITSVRIRFFSNLDPLDITYTFSEIALLSSLVPLLGIINACLPVLAPAFKRIFNSSLLSSTVKKSDNTGSSSNKFHRLNEPELPLVNMNSPYNRHNASDAAGHISVTTDWEVHSIQASDTHINDIEMNK